MQAPILRVVTTLEDGSVSRHVLAVTRAVDTEHPAVLVAGYPSLERGELRDSAVSTQRVPLVRAVSPLYDARALFALRGMVATHRPWMVETHMAKAGTLGRLAALTSDPRPKTIHTFHRHALRDYLRSAVARAFIEVERRLARSTDRLVALTPETRDECLDLGIGKASQWRIVPLALEPDPPLVLRRSLGIPPDVLLAGTFAGREGDTDHATLLEAVRLTPGLHLVIVGDGYDRAILGKSIHVAGLDDRVHLAGWLGDIPGTMHEVDLVAVSSRSRASPAELEKAAQAGRPLVAAAVGDTGSIVREGITGFQVPPCDPESMSQRFRALSDEAKRREMGQAASPLAKRLAIEPTIAAIRELYGELSHVGTV
ncbi:MAG TPA: glycosyltransferase [Acidimicrobiales bacterium]|nr:glycosyltransferase [Acidimicrobiales bacterium]